MCGIVGIFSKKDVKLDLYDALTMLQHRGQDAAGIMTCHNGRFNQRKSIGLVKDVFNLFCTSGRGALVCILTF